MTVVVHTRSKVYGPFADSNEAMEWVRLVLERTVPTEQPLSIMDVTDPETVIAVGWQKKRVLRDVHGNEVTLEQVDEQMGYRPRPDGVEWAP